MKYLIFSICILCMIASCKENLPENRNEEASIPESFGFEKMNLKTLTTFINPKAKTTSTLFGNESAYEAMKNNKTSIKDQKELLLVTWDLKEDEKWFGAMVPGELVSVEELKSNDFVKDTLPEYSRLNGKSLKKDITIDENIKRDRIKLILSLKPAVTP